MIISDEDLFSFAETIWSSILGMKLTPGDNGDVKPDTDATIACVQVTGDWEGAVTVRCSADLASKLASAMFAMEPDELSQDEIRDAMGELVNMTGGNVKGLAPGENTLALPTVAVGDESTVTITKSKQLNQVVGWCEDEVVVFTVVGRQD